MTSSERSLFRIDQSPKAACCRAWEAAHRKKHACGVHRPSRTNPNLRAVQNVASVTVGPGAWKSPSPVRKRARKLPKTVEIEPFEVSQISDHYPQQAMTISFN